MATMCTIAAKLAKARDEALAWIPLLREEVQTALIVEIIGTKFREAVPWVMVDATVNNVISCVSATILKQLGINQASPSQEIRGAMEMPTGTAVTRDASLPLAVAQAKLAKAVTVAGKDFRSEWSKAMKEATDAIAEKFAHLMTGGQLVIIAPCVPKEHVADLHAELKNLDENFKPSVCRTEHLSQVPDLCVHIANHVVSTPYSFDYQKCNNGVCCSAKNTLDQFSSWN
jgi:hypothetical protein